MFANEFIAIDESEVAAVVPINACSGHHCKPLETVRENALAVLQIRLRHTAAGAHLVNINFFDTGKIAEPVVIQCREANLVRGGIVEFRLALIPKNGSQRVGQSGLSEPIERPSVVSTQGV